MERQEGHSGGTPPVRSVILRRQHDHDGHRHLSASLDAHGDLRITGHDLGPGVTRVFGEGIDEYEWEHTVRAAHVPQLAVALGGEPDADVLELLQSSSAAGHQGAQIVPLLQRHQIPFESWTWTTGP